MIYNSFYWVSATALEPINNHEIVILENIQENKFTIRHAKNENDWLYNKAAYINVPTKTDIFGRPIPINIQKGDECRCLIVDVIMR